MAACQCIKRIYGLNMQMHRKYSIYVMHIIFHYDILFLQQSWIIEYWRCLPSQTVVSYRLTRMTPFHPWRGRIIEKREGTWTSKKFLRNYLKITFSTFPIHFRTQPSMLPQVGPTWWPSREAWPFACFSSSVLEASKQQWNNHVPVLLQV